jgi:cation diffusion facilitator family transporter
MLDMSSGHGNRAIMAAFFANLGIAVSKLVAFGFTGSAAMLAESVHSIADTGNQGLLLLGGRRAKRAATPEHPFGYGSERYFWAFVVAMVLFTLGAAFAIGEGIEKILNPHELEAPGWAIGVLLIAVVLESFSFRTALREARALRTPGTSLWHYIRWSKAPEVPVVLLEDLAALLGLLFALTAVLLSFATGNGIYDGFGTLAIGLLLAVVAAILAIEMKSLLIGESASGSMKARIGQAMESQPCVERLIHMRTLHLGPEEVLVAAKLEFKPTLSSTALADAVNDVEAAVRAEVPEATVIYIEPDVLRAAV